MNFRSTDRIEKSTYFLFLFLSGREATTGNASAVRRLDHSYFTSQVVCLIWLTAVSFDRLIEPHVINVTTIVDGKK